MSTRPATSDKSFALIEKAVAGILDKGAVPVVLGGDHSITYPVIKAFARKHKPLDILHFDAHPDLYEDLYGDRLSHACPFARIMEDGLAQNLVQVGIRAATPDHKAKATKHGVRMIEMKEIHEPLFLKFANPLYISFDLDALDPAFAPGVSHHEPGRTFDAAGHPDHPGPEGQDRGIRHRRTQRVPGRLRHHRRRGVQALPGRSRERSSGREDVGKSRPPINHPPETRDVAQSWVVIVFWAMAVSLAAFVLARTAGERLQPRPGARGTRRLARGEAIEHFKGRDGEVSDREQAVLFKSESFLASCRLFLRLDRGAVGLLPFGYLRTNLYNAFAYLARSFRDLEDEMKKAGSCPTPFPTAGRSSTAWTTSSPEWPSADNLSYLHQKYVKARDATVYMIERLRRRLCPSRVQGPGEHLSLQL